LLQLVPLPADVWANLPGHAFYVQSLEIAGNAWPAWRPASIHANATEYAWLAMLPCLAIFLVVQELTRRQVRVSVLALIAVAVIQALLGILQVGAGPASVFYFGNELGGTTSVGTYVNRNHFAGFLSLVLPIAVAAWALEMLPPRSRMNDPAHVHARTEDSRLALRIAWSFVILLLLVALILTRSRAGVSIGLSGFAMASMAMILTRTSTVTKTVFCGVGVLSLLLAAFVGLTPSIDPFQPQELSQAWTGRSEIVRASLVGARAFFPIGSGLGTYADVFSAFQAPNLSGYINHAHNDYVEALFEIGVPGAVAIGLFLFTYVQRFMTLLHGPDHQTLTYFQVGAGIGMLSMLVHGLFDFNFHIPANALYFSFLAGVFVMTPHHPAH
jgi:O-antigen ligase